MGRESSLIAAWAGQAGLAAASAWEAALLPCLWHCISPALDPSICREWLGWVMLWGGHRCSGSSVPSCTVQLPFQLSSLQSPILQAGAHKGGSWNPHDHHPLRSWLSPSFLGCRGVASAFPLPFPVLPLLCKRDWLSSAKHGGTRSKEGTTPPW